MIDTAWSAQLGSLSFAWPWMLWLLPVPLLWGSIRLPQAPGRRTALDAAAPALPASLTAALGTTGKPGLRGAQRDRWLLALGWFALIVALAQPERAGPVTLTPVSGRALALAIDLSGSMERDDFTLDGVASDRLSVVKRVAGDFIRRRDGDRVGLVLFGKEAFIASPLTFDLASLADALAGAGIGMAGRSTAIGDAIGLCLSMLRVDPATQKAIVLLSDGTNNSGSVEPEAAAELADTLGVRIHTIALGSEARSTGGLSTAPSADLDETTLAAIAERSGGRHWRARSSEDLDTVYTAIDQLERSANLAPPTRPSHDLRHWPLLALFALLLAGAWREARQ